MGSIVIALPKTDDANRIAGIIRGKGLPYDINICATGAQVLQVSNNRDFGVVICTKRLRDMSYIELADMLPEGFGTLIFTNDSSLECVRHNMVKLMLPFRKSDLIDTIEMLVSDFVRRPRRKRDIPPKRSKDEQKIIDNAKSMLMDRNGMSEPEAFRYIQKNSMDNSRKLVETAQMILILYSDS